MLGGRWRLSDLERIVRLPGFDPVTLESRTIEARCSTIVHIVASHVAKVAGDARWEEIAARIPPARPDYAARVLATLRGERTNALLTWRLEVRASSDSPARRLGALAVTALRELELQLA